MIVPVILAGGSGSRLWPLSRSAYPKQLLSLVDNLTMLQETVTRTQSIVNIAAPLVICNEEHRFLVAEQLHQIGIQNAVIILEPVGKNTAPAAAISALYLRKIYQEDPVLLVLPADHVIKNVHSFLAAIAVAEKYAQEGKLVTFGVLPTHAETGYGYIKAGVSIDAQSAVCKIEQFVEKPNQSVADAYVACGEYYWNSGMFMFRAAQFLHELDAYAPEILTVCKQTIEQATVDLDFIRLNKDLFAQCPGDSIDYAVMEKTTDGVLIPLDSEWSDVGSWAALWEAQEKDMNGNVLQGDVIAEQVSNSYLLAESRMLAVVGVTDHVIVETPDVVLVAHKDHCQSVKDIVNTLKKQHRTETDLHRKVYRPWGYYQSVDQGEGFQVKRITVKPGARLSLQMHHHRSEHWIVVSGIAEVTRGEEVFTIKANESTYIPCLVKHRLANPSDVNLEIIEVQSGSYLGEDDIVRFEDVYGRTMSSEKIPYVSS
jgi:mannose-1-phosphate guanylyltransferase/mannose-6-phosphate isomerase